MKNTKKTNPYENLMQNWEKEMESNMKRWEREGLISEQFEPNQINIRNLFNKEMAKLKK